MLILLIISFFTLHSFAQTTTVAIKDVAVIDMKSGKVNKGQTVIIEGNRIISIKPNGAIPTNAVVIEANGKYLIPGLWDMHAHAFTDRKFEWLFPLLIVNGITGVRDLATSLPFDSIHFIRKEIAEGRLLGPRFGEVTQRTFNGIPLPGIPIMEVTTADEARKQVQFYKQQGMDFVKVYNQLTREMFLAIVDEAKLQKIPFAGHVPYGMSAGEVSDLGQLSIEHNTDILVSCSSDEVKLRQELDSLPRTIAIGAAPRQNVDIKAMQTFDEQKAIRLFNRFKQNGTWMCPTLVIPQRSLKNVDELSQDDRLQFIPQRFRDQWSTQMRQRNINPPNENMRLLAQKRIEIVGLMHRTGVNILAGSDFMNPYVYPGFSLHDELELFVQAGLSPFEALKTATVNAAEFLHKENELGTVEAGKYADLVLLDANPLENISNIKRIHAVIANGRLFNRVDLDTMLDRIKNLAK